MNIRIDSWHFRFIGWSISESLNKHYHYSHRGMFGDPNEKDGYRLNICQYISLFGMAVLNSIFWFIVASFIGGVIGTMLYDGFWQVVFFTTVAAAVSGIFILLEKRDELIWKAKYKLQNYLYGYSEEGSFRSVVREYYKGWKDKYCVTVNIIDPTDTPEHAIAEVIAILDEKMNNDKT